MKRHLLDQLFQWGMIMLRNQKGFTYPITLCFLFLFSTLLVIHTEQIITEKRMLMESETILKQDFYVHSTIKEVKQLLSSGEIPSTTGTILFYDGEANYRLEQKSQNIWQIQINIRTTVNGIKKADFLGFAQYDTEKNRMIKWMEVN